VVLEEDWRALRPSG